MSVDSETATNTAPFRLILIRHGDTDYTLSGRYQGHRDEPLNEQGRQQARALRLRLRKALGDMLHECTVCASDLRRARDTARLAVPGRDAQIDARLRELNFGSFEGFTAVENDARSPAFAAWREDPERNPPPQGESVSALGNRLSEWLQQLQPGNTVAFTHGGAIRMLIALATNTPFMQLRGLLIAPTDAVILRLDAQRCCALEQLEWHRCPPVLEVAHD